MLFAEDEVEVRELKSATMGIEGNRYRLTLFWQGCKEIVARAGVLVFISMFRFGSCLIPAKMRQDENWL